jgi:uncharacterized LabA/DUF88 family protein
VVAVLVGAYVDGFNLYYGGVALAGGHGVPGWRWIDLRKLATDLLARHSGWPNAMVSKVVYCTARIKGGGAAVHQQQQRDQDTYLRALVAANAVDHIEYGHYVSRVATAPLANRDAHHRPVLVEAAWPVMVRDSAERDVAGATFMVSVARREEKGTDVNLATHLMLDALRGSIEGALVFSNDSDLALPVEKARNLIPVGVINPTAGRAAGALKIAAGHPAGQHWGRRLTLQDLVGAQLPSQIGKLRKPVGW